MQNLDVMLSIKLILCYRYFPFEPNTRTHTRKRCATDTLFYLAALYMAKQTGRVYSKSIPHISQFDWINWNEWITQATNKHWYVNPLYYHDTRLLVVWCFRLGFTIQLFCLHWKWYVLVIHCEIEISNISIFCICSVVADSLKSVRNVFWLWFECKRLCHPAHVLLL